MQEYKDLLAQLLAVYSSLPHPKLDKALLLLEEVLVNCTAIRDNWEGSAANQSFSKEEKYDPPVPSSTEVAVPPAVHDEDEYSGRPDYCEDSDTEGNVADDVELSDTDWERSKKKKRKRRNTIPRLSKHRGLQAVETPRKRGRPRKNSLPIKLEPLSDDPDTTRNETPPEITRRKSGRGRPKGSRNRSKEQIALSKEMKSRHKGPSKHHTLPAPRYAEIWDAVSPYMEHIPASGVCNILESSDGKDSQANGDECSKSMNQTDLPNLSTDSPNRSESYYRCTACGHQVKLRHSLLQHVLNHHAKDIKPHSCKLCGKSFARPKYLETHMFSHKKDQKTMLCDQCPFSTHNPEILSRHRALQHTDSVPMFDCPLCDYSTKYRSSLDEHRRRHTGEKPFSCRVCGKTFASSATTRVHEKRHEERRHTCSICEKKFVTIDKLRLHSVIHTGLKPYSCQFCDYRCNIKTNLAKHNKNVHKFVPPSTHFVRITKGVDNGPNENVQANTLQKVNTIVLQRDTDSVTSNSATEEATTSRVQMEMLRKFNVSPPDVSAVSEMPKYPQMAELQPVSNAQNFVRLEPSSQEVTWPATSYAWPVPQAPVYPDGS